MNPIRGEDRVARLAAAAVPAVILCIGAWILSGPPTRLALRLYDDAYYYFGVARNLAHGAGSTFDGIHATNGYHPLWCWLLVPLMRFVDDPDRGVRAAGALWFLLAAGSAVAVAWAVRPRSGPAGGAIAAAVFALHPFLGLSLERPNGLETPLYALTIALAVGVFERAEGRTSPWILLGAVAGLVALARLDGAFLAVSAALLLVASPGGGRRARSAGLVAVVSAVMVAPFLAWGAARFDSPLPVSGQVVAMGAAKEREALGGAGSPAFWKRRAVYAVRDIPSGVGRVALDRIPGARSIGRGAAPAVLAIGVWVAVVGAGLARRRSGGARSRDALALLALFAVLHYSAYALWLWTGGEERYRLYYFLPQWMAFAMGLGALAGGRSANVRRGRAAALVVAILAGHVAWAVRDRELYQDVSERPVSRSFVYGWIRENLPEGAVLGARDAGKLGWFSGRKVVNLDGLINDRRMVEAIRNGEEVAYLVASPIDYLFYTPEAVDAFVPGGPRPPETKPVARILHDLDARDDRDVRRLPGPTEGWEVFEITRR